MLILDIVLGLGCRRTIIRDLIEMFLKFRWRQCLKWKFCKGHNFCFQYLITYIFISILYSYVVPFIYFLRAFKMIPGNMQCTFVYKPLEKGIVHYVNRCEIGFMETIYIFFKYSYRPIKLVMENRLYFVYRLYF